MEIYKNAQETQPEKMFGTH